MPNDSPNRREFLKAAGASSLFTRNVKSRYQRVVQAGTRERPGAAFQKAREIVRSGVLGNITFCRGFFQDWVDGVHLIDAVQFVFDEVRPVSVTAQSTPNIMLVTCRYAGFIASFESRSACRGTAVCGTSFHGDKATLVVSCNGYADSLTVAAPVTIKDRAFAVKQNEIEV